MTWEWKKLLRRLGWGTFNWDILGWCMGLPPPSQLISPWMSFYEKQHFCTSFPLLPASSQTLQTLHPYPDSQGPLKWIQNHNWPTEHHGSYVMENGLHDSHSLPETDISEWKLNFDMFWVAMFEMPQNIVHHCICKLRAFLANCNFSALLC